MCQELSEPKLVPLTPEVFFLNTHLKVIDFVFFTKISLSSPSRPSSNQVKILSCLSSGKIGEISSSRSSWPRSTHCITASVNELRVRCQPHRHIQWHGIGLGRIFETTASKCVFIAEFSCDASITSELKLFDSPS